MRIRRRTFTTREDALPCSYTQRAEPTNGNVDMRETNAGLSVAVSSEAKNLGSGKMKAMKWKYTKKEAGMKVKSGKQ